MKDFIGYFSRLTTLSKELEECLLLRVKEQNVKKGDHLHSAGKICEKTYWVQKGMLRLYYLKEGKEITDAIAAEGETITSAQSFMKNIPDQYYLQAIEDSELYSLTNRDVFFLFEHFPEMERFGRITMSLAYVQLSERLASYQFTSAKEKYIHFCTTYKTIHPRIPLGMVASYLGISQETLSRIRNEV